MILSEFNLFLIYSDLEIGTIELTGKDFPVRNRRYIPRVLLNPGTGSGC